MPGRHLVVAVEDGRQHQPAHPRQREHRLGDDRPAEQVAHLDPEHRRERDQGVADGVADQHQALAQALGAGRPDVVGVEHVEQAGAEVAHQLGGRERPERDRRQDHALEVRARPAESGVKPPAGKPWKLDGEHVDQHDPEPEAGDRQADEAERRRTDVEPGPGLDGRDDPGRDGDR